MTHPLTLTIPFLLAGALLAASDVTPGMNRFAATAYRQLAPSNNNLILSPFSISTALSMLLDLSLIHISFSDLEARILPDEFTLGGMAAGLVLSWFVPVKPYIAEVLLWGTGLHRNSHWTSLTEALLGAIIPGFCLWLAGWLYFKLRQREGLGLGDVKLVAMVGAFLGCLLYTSRCV